MNTYAYIGFNGFPNIKFEGKVSELMPFLNDYAKSQTPEGYEELTGLKYDMVDSEIYGDE